MSQPHPLPQPPKVIPKLPKPSPFLPPIPIPTSLSPSRHPSSPHTDSSSSKLTTNVTTTTSQHGYNLSAPPPTSPRTPISSPFLTSPSPTPPPENTEPAGHNLRGQGGKGKPSPPSRPGGVALPGIASSNGRGHGVAPVPPQLKENIEGLLKQRAEEDSKVSRTLGIFPAASSTASTSASPSPSSSGSSSTPLPEGIPPPLPSRGPAALVPSPPPIRPST
jgi:hypothetical protein